MNNGAIRVLVAEDSLTIRKHIVEVIASAPGLEVVGEAGDGKLAIELCERTRPSVITMDMMMPVMSGLAATEYIMAYCPTPILVVSASTNRGELFRTYDALAAGAIDVLEKPHGGDLDEDWEERLVAALRLISRIRVITHPRARLQRASQIANPTADAPAFVEPGERKLVAIGASTGGPAAVLSVLRSLPSNFALPVLVVLHISEPFGLAMAEWLDGQLTVSVRYAIDGEKLPRPGQPCVLLAPPGRHLELIGGRLCLSEAPERHSCRPSVDVLFESLARELGSRTIACLLTGMGRDGAQGLLAIRQSGGLTLAQDEASSVVYGMPAEAVKLGAAAEVLPLSQFAQALFQAAKPETRSKHP